MMMLAVSGCGSTTPKGASLTLSTLNTIENYGEFSLFKVVTTEDIKAPIHQGLYYESKSENETYVDVVIDWKNLSTQSVREDELFTISAKNEATIQYSDVLYVVETDRGTSVRQLEDIAPLTTARIHCGISVPKTETQLTITLKVKNEEYVFEYTVGSIMDSAPELKVDDMIEHHNYAFYTFKGVEYTDDLLPADTSRSYNHYQVDNKDNTYLVAKFEFKNLSTDTLNCDEIFGITATYMDKYKYHGFVVVEDEDLRGFSSYESIKPLTTRNFYYLIEVPKSVMEESLRLDIYCNNQEYVYTK